MNTIRPAGWLVCGYLKNGGCLLGKGLHPFEIEQGGTSRLERHTVTHCKGSCIVPFQRQLSSAARTKLAHSAVLVACLDIRPLLFCDNNVGMRCFAQTIFELGQTVPVNERIDLRPYYPERTAVSKAVKDISSSPK